MNLEKKRYFKKKIQEKTEQIWDKGFLKRYLSEIREGVRVEYDRLKESLDGTMRRLCFEKYTVMYTGDDDKAAYEYDINQLPLSPEEIDSLPTEPTEGNRYYKVVKEKYDEKLVETLTDQAAKLKTQVDQLANNMKAMTQRIEGPLMDDQGNDQSLNGTIDGMYTLVKILKGAPQEPMKILITGDKGFVGTATKEYIKGINSNTPNAQGPLEVIGYDLMDGCDIRDLEQLERFVVAHKPDRILHLAAIARFSDADKDPKLAHETNVIGTYNVAKVAGKHHIPVVYASTGSVYMPIHEEPPITEEFKACGNSVYGVTKYLGEEYIRDISSVWIILRYAHLYGKEKRYHGLIGGFVSRIERGLSPTLYGGKQSNDFTYIKDIARANYLALTTPWDKWNQSYNIGTGEEITAEKAATLICEATGYKGDIEVKEQRTVDPEHFVYDIKKAETMLGFKAEYDFKSGLQDMFSGS